MMSERPRRVVTGHDENGRSIVAIDGPAPVTMPNEAIRVDAYPLWRSAGTPAPVENGPDAALQPPRIAPPPNGSHFFICDFKPDPFARGGAFSAAQQAVMNKTLGVSGAAGGLTHGEGSAHPGMHRTQTLDYAIVIEGEIVLVLTDSEVPLKAGDVVVQRGADHAWSNRTDKLARVAFVMLDGRFTSEFKSLLKRPQ
jgi:quercetin dioxygenase-like cupin family protein